MITSLWQFRTVTISRIVSEELYMTDQEEAGLKPIGAEGAQLKQKITNDKAEAKAESFDPGMAMHKHARHPSPASTSVLGDTFRG